MSLVAAVMLICPLYQPTNCEQHHFYVERKACGYSVQASRDGVTRGRVTIRCKR